MKRMVLAFVGGLILVTGMVSAQEPETAPEPVQADEGDEAEPRSRPVRKIRVLQDPYQIASFYRSSQERRAPMYFGAAPLTERGTLSERYPIASYYRQGGGRGTYSRFWTSSNGSTFGSSRRFAPVRSRRIGPSELCLFAPTFLAPVAPLADIDR